MRQNFSLRVAVSAFSLAATAIHIWTPLTIDSITIVLLVIAALPWVQPLVKSVELLGVKLELQELQTKVAEARGAAESAARQAGLALAGNATPLSPTHDAQTQSVAPATIESLATEYERIRETQRAGEARTAAMTVIVRRMIDLATQMREFDLDKPLTQSSRGERLFAYAYLYARPESRWLIPLVESITGKEDTPFGQYWGLQALGRMLSVAPAKVLPEVRSKLLALGATVPPGTDRDYMIGRLLREMK